MRKGVWKHGKTKREVTLGGGGEGGLEQPLWNIELCEKPRLEPWCHVACYKLLQSEAAPWRCMWIQIQRVCAIALSGLHEMHTSGSPVVSRLDSSDQGHQWWWKSLHSHLCQEAAQPSSYLGEQQRKATLLLLPLMGWFPWCEHEESSVQGPGLSPEPRLTLEARAFSASNASPQAHQAFSEHGQQ